MKLRVAKKVAKVSVEGFMFFRDGSYAFSELPLARHRVGSMSKAVRRLIRIAGDGTIWWNKWASR